MRRTISFFALLLLQVAGCTAVSTDQFREAGKEPLQRPQLEELVLSQVVRLESIDFDAKLTFAENGQFSAKSRTNDSDTGKWIIDEDNRLCLKFSAWFFGDLRCFEVFSESAGSYGLFTSNGARAYSATTKRKAVSQSSRPEEKQTVSQNSSVKRQKSSRTESTASRASDTKVTMKNLAQNCPGCNFTGADLQNTYLIGANLEGANLEKADLSGANLRRANLSGANLNGADLHNINLAGANLQNASLVNANLSGANLIKADLTNANYSSANFSGAYLEGIKGYDIKQ